MAIFFNEEPVTVGVGAHRVPSVPKKDDRDHLV